MFHVSRHLGMNVILPLPEVQDVATWSGPGGVLSIPGGAEEGDVAVGYLADEGSSTPTGWTSLLSGGTGFDWGWGAIWKVLTAGDISGGVTWGAGGRVVLSIKRRASQAVLRTYAAENDLPATSPLSAGGFTKHAGCRGLEAVFMTRETPTLTGPAGWSSLFSAASEASWRERASEYVDGTAIEVGFSSANRVFLAVVEFR